MESEIFFFFYGRQTTLWGTKYKPFSTCDISEFMYFPLNVKEKGKVVPVLN